MKQKFQSPSTPNVKHDVPNLLVEAMMINRYGLLPPGSWRKGGALKDNWGLALIKIKTILTRLKLDERRLAWYVKQYKIEDVDFEEFGLLHYKVNRQFKWINLESFTQYYVELHNQYQKAEEAASYINNTRGYQMREISNKTRSLTDILSELEAEDNDE